MKNQTKPQLSIVIVNWNTGNYLVNCVHSICEAVSQLPYEVIVIDNASNDRSAEIAKEEFPEIVLINNSQNLGFSKANNIGISKSKGEYVLLLNPDTIVLDNALERLVSFLQGRECAVAAGPKILNEDGTIQFTCARHFPTPLSEFFILSWVSSMFPRNRVFGYYLMTYWDHSTETEIDAISGACIVIKKEVFERIGMLDEQFFIYGEDIELCHRIKKAGYQIYYVPDAEIIHFGAKSSEKNQDRIQVQSFQSKYLFFKKCYSGISASIYRLIVFGCVLARHTFRWLQRIIGRLDRDTYIDRSERYKKALRWALLLK